MNAYTSCTLCPRCCSVNRTAGQTGFCKETADLKIASACLHFGEEPPLTGKGGSGTIFISGCNLGCGFCQNYQISREGMGRIVDCKEFCRICSALEQAGAENINIVTGSHAIPAIASFLTQAKKEGLGIPVCWNSSAYENIDAIDMLAPVTDIWLPDLKAFGSAASEALLGTGDYARTAKKAIRHMIELAPLRFEPVTTRRVQSGRKEARSEKCADAEKSKRASSTADVENAVNDKNTESAEKMVSGVIVRHLVMPGCLDNTVKVLDWLKEHADGKACISLMSQYTPVVKNGTQQNFPDRFINRDEFEYIKQLIHDYDFDYLFYQELENDDSWLPDFSRVQPFSNSLATPVWHWKNGFTNSML